MKTFFKEFQDRGEPSRRAQSLGSGFIIDAAGIVVTNNHVIENADEISVILANDESFQAKVIGRDAKTDIAVLQIDPGESKLTAVSFGNSDGLRSVIGLWLSATRLVSEERSQRESYLLEDVTLALGLTMILF